MQTFHHLINIVQVLSIFAGVSAALQIHVCCVFSFPTVYTSTNIQSVSLIIYKSLELIATGVRSKKDKEFKFPIIRYFLLLRFWCLLVTCV